MNLTPPTPQFASDVPANISSPAVAANPLILAKPNGGPETKIVQEQIKLDSEDRYFPLRKLVENSADVQYCNLYSSYGG